MKLKKLLSIAALSIAAFACTPNIISSDEGAYDIKDVPETGGTYDFIYSAKSSWGIVNKNDWFKVSPEYGNVGDIKIKVVVSPNHTPFAREGKFIIADGANNVSVKVNQIESMAIVLEKEEYNVPMDGGDFKLKVGYNSPFEVSTDADWVTCPSTKAANYQESEFVFKIEANPTEKVRKAKITFRSEDGTKAICTFVQCRIPYKSVVGLRFTGTWCGYCTAMIHDVADMNRKRSGRLNCINFYNNSGASISTPQEDVMRGVYSISGWPSIVLDNRVKFSNLGVGDNYTAMSEFIDEMLESYPAVTAIALDTKLEGNTIDITTKVYSQLTADMQLFVFVLENGLVARQTDYVNIYSSSELANMVHNNVVKGYATSLTEGESFSIKEYETKTFHHTVDVPSSVYRKENMSIIAFVARPKEAGPSNVKKVQYINTKKTIFDNSIICPINTSVDFKYE